MSDFEIHRDIVHDHKTLVTVTGNLPDANKSFQVTAQWCKKGNRSPEEQLGVSWSPIGMASRADTRICAQALILACDELDKLVAETNDMN